jgi:hypothetical protein
MPAKRGATARQGRQGRITTGEDAATVAQAALAGSPKAGVPPTRQSSPFSATGQAVMQAEGLEHIPKGKDRGAPGAPDMGDPLKAKPRGLQKEKAIFTSNGEVDTRLAPTPSGPQPAVAATHEEGEKQIKERRDAHQQFIETRSSQRAKRLSEATISRLNHAELRAIASQRGYQDIPEHGNRTTRTWFAEQQKQDKLLGKEEI